MQKRGRSSSAKPDPIISPKVQYRETYESRRQHDRFIWQTPAIIIGVDGALIATTFAFVQLWVVREFIIAFALILTAALIHALIKHRYFMDLEEKTLLALEDKWANKRIQRLTTPDKEKEYWATEEEPNRLQKQSAHLIFRRAMYAVFYMLVALMFVNPLVVGDTVRLP